LSFSLPFSLPFSVKNVWETNNIFRRKLCWKTWISQPVIWSQNWCNHFRAGFINCAARYWLEYSTAGYWVGGQLIRLHWRHVTELTITIVTQADLAVRKTWSWHQGWLIWMMRINTTVLHH
jgi:hypothetical protein